MCKLAYNLLKLFLLEVKGGKMETKFCEFCGNKVAIDAVLCPKCGKQLEELKTETSNSNSQVVINNSNTINGAYGRKQCDKWIALLLCIFLGVFGGHKFYEGKAGMVCFHSSRSDRRAGFFHVSDAHLLILQFF